VFEFPSGKSYFKAFKLPEPAVDYTITLKSYAGGDHIPKLDSYPGWYPSSVFVPALMLLDADYMPTRLVDEKLTRRTDATLLPPARLGMETVITIGPQNKNERFLVIFTPRRLLGQVTEATVPHAIRIIGGAIPTGLREPAHMYHAPVGTLAITLSGSDEQ
jgi:hypothetical protein